MCENLQVTEYTFQKLGCEGETHLFPVSMEEDDNIWFHCAAASNLSSILRQGLRPHPNSNLKSVSYGRNSYPTLGVVCDIHPNIQERCIIVFGFGGMLSKPFLVTEGTFDMQDHRWDLDPKPRIVGYMRVPVGYQHI